MFPMAMFLRQKNQRQPPATDIIVVAWATLGDVTQIEVILSMLCAVADIFAYKHCQCTLAFHYCFG